MNSEMRTALLIPTLLLAMWLRGTAPAYASIDPVPGKIHPSLLARMDRMEANGKTAARIAVWVFFADKGELVVPDDLPEVTARAEARRAKVGYVPSEVDLPLWPPYVDSVETLSGPTHSRTKWINGVTVAAPVAKIRSLADLSFVTRIQETAKRVLSPEPDIDALPRSSSSKTGALDYGTSEFQLTQTNVPPLHDAGLTGSGVHILMLDSGFHTGAPAFDNMDIARRYDFVNDDEIVEDELTGTGGEGHGSGTLSAIGAGDFGALVGPAFGATYYLAKTEDAPNEYRGEEGHWAEGIEWGESLGVDIASSSLGYANEMDDATDNYTYEDMDGRTTAVTLAAAEAIRHGILVVNAMGNEGGFLKPWKFMIAPADGDSVLSVGAVMADGGRSPFSSFGPTFDGRMKPEVSALGSGTAIVVSPRSETNPYGANSGTSFSAPIVAGICALLLEARPSLTPIEIIEALKSTASQADSADNEIGWGIVNAEAAAIALDAFQDTRAPEIVHIPIESILPEEWPVALTATITDASGIESDEVGVEYQYVIQGDMVVPGDFPLNAVVKTAGDEWTGTFPTGMVGSGDRVFYRIFAEDSLGNRAAVPSATEFYSFQLSPRRFELILEEVPNPYVIPGERPFRIAFDLPEPGSVRIEIYDIAGRLVREVLNETRSTGTHKIDWDGKNDAGDDVSHGVYFLRLESGPFEETRKFVILRN